MQLYRDFVIHSSEFCRHNPLCCFATSVYCCKCIFRYGLSLQTFGHTHTSQLWAGGGRKGQSEVGTWLRPLAHSWGIYTRHRRLHRHPPPHMTDSSTFQDGRPMTNNTQMLPKIWHRAMSPNRRLEAKTDWLSDCLHLHIRSLMMMMMIETILETSVTTTNTRWEATQRVMAAKLTRLTHKIAIQLHLVAESCTICSSRSRRPVLKLLDTPSYTPWLKNVLTHVT
jgi:hypothetical protein